MDVITMQVFVSLVLVLGALLLFGISMRNRDHEHADRLSLLPMADDDGKETDRNNGNQNDHV